MSRGQHRRRESLTLSHLGIEVVRSVGSRAYHRVSTDGLHIACGTFALSSVVAVALVSNLKGVCEHDNCRNSAERALKRMGSRNCAGKTICPFDEMMVLMEVRYLSYLGNGSR